MPARDESPYPPFEKHYHMVALELRGADKTAVFDFLRTDAGMLGEVLNRLVREDCLAADHSAAFLDRSVLQVHIRGAFLAFFAGDDGVVSVFVRCVANVKC